MTTQAQQTQQAQLHVNENNAAYAAEYHTIQATIQRIVFHNPENGYCVISVTVNEKSISPADGVTEEWHDNLKMTGHLAAPREGDEYRFTGTYATHPKFGRQLKFTDAELLLPVGRSGIARYLSQITHGVGVAKAEKIVAALGEEALSLIRENPEALNHPDLSFLTEIQKQEIAADLTKNSIQAELAALICGPGIGMGNVTRILNSLGATQETLKLIKENPYCLTEEVFGIGFKLADTIALKVGIPKNSPFRIDAALNYVLKEAAGEGHCYLTPTLIVEALLGTIEAERLSGRKIRGAREKKREGIIAYSGVGIEEIRDGNLRLIEAGKCVREGDAVYDKGLWLAECLVAERVRELVGQDWEPAEPREGCNQGYNRKLEPGKPDTMDILKAILGDIQSRDSVEYAPEQKKAVFTALHEALSIITGGPGTGKTTTINAIIDIYKHLNPIHYIYLAAPTGRAAKRMSEATGHEAKTIHRLLCYNPRNGSGGGFGYNIDEPLPGPGLIIIDEVSMLDIELASHLFAAIETGGVGSSNQKTQHQVVLVGDIDQLPSVGPGSVLRDLIQSSRVPTTRLEFNYRQAGGSKIAEFAHRVCRGEMIPLKDHEGNEDLSIGDFEFSHADGGDEAASTINWLAETYVKAQNLNPLDWQVLVPMRRNSCGVQELNKSLRDIVNPVTSGQDGEIKSLGHFRLGDKVMVIKNNYNLEVFNGDIGMVVSIDRGTLTVDFGDGRDGGREVEFEFEHLELLKLAYASTIHKAQGSEFKLVILALCSQHYIMLQRNLLYTGMTRAKDKLILVGDSKSVAMAVKNSKIEERLSRLSERVRGE